MTSQYKTDKQIQAWKLSYMSTTRFWFCKITPNLQSILVLVLQGSDSSTLKDSLHSIHFPSLMLFI